MKFEWNAEKAKINIAKHNVNFNKAVTVFDDSLANIFNDEWHSLEENREIIIGLSKNKRILIVSFTEKIDGILRIISARLATSKERKDYEQYRRH
jgi:hypothetical protein